MRYTPPSTLDLADLKANLNRTGDEMADLFGLAGSHQWRKYTGGQQPREMSLQMAFFAAARLELDPAQIARIIERMRTFGADLNLDD
ncbi:TPA: XRE family transcriptional regulator [Burkholderia contaminans]|uniref:transcriptional regulator n=1 Tax=Burkholderia contaminans TaxID=488447 RepID=UPI000D0026A0|nr:transcriptional regulator [Burkholderia contaminans]HDR9065459.1 XRE family transcriptional regulator [Burkholderia vietnamiensis]MBM6427898.1 XRE family transcriptional regulator [Burkholderia contaminans]MCA7876729.1 XRE family transcriptional regulator [Burkholderia contaminans]MDN8024248.1 XRE family transcriptional regulator [Burkholderia contaminans]PRG14348.1 transcriptional regulator [Burkholderia contaminans]